MMIAFRFHAIKANESSEEDIDYMRHRPLRVCLTNIMEKIEDN